MKYTFVALGALLLSSCLSSNSLINEEPYLYTLESKEGKKTFVKSHSTNTLSKNNLENLKKHLTDINPSDIDFSKKIVVNFINNNPSISIKNYQVPWDIFYGNMQKKLNSIEPCNHFWIINKDVTDLYYYHGNKINWIIDKQNIIKKLFFNYDKLNGGFLILKPNGEYFIKKGEYTKSDVLDIMRSF
ncbi:hypothetical protein [Pseudofulvibacter geojedonensis]|uniref:Lipoprotein n=1 Tax=Pseudofulvibacter geojedonensis TaxID=1123758 RepID=A0ABW3I555_9FLAO